MIWVSLASDVIDWSSWLWQHRAQFGPVLNKLGDMASFAQAALANPEGALRRVGNTLIFGQPDGGERVMAFIEQAGPGIQHVQQAVAGLQAGQTAMTASLGSLQKLSMVTLGLTALTPVMLSAQFIALSRRLGNLQKQIAKLQKKFDETKIADLRTGLELLQLGQDFLDKGDNTNANSRLSAALPDCIRSMKYFGGLLNGELSQNAINRDEVRLLARHLSVATTAVASCQVGLEQDQHAFAQSTHEVDLLRQAARHIFHETVARDPAPYMHPSLSTHGVTIDFMSRLYRQARDAGALDAEQDCSVSSWFEANRSAIFRARRPWMGWDTDDLRSRLQEAVSAVEETNRVVGLAKLVDHVRGAGWTTREVMERCKQKGRGQDPEANPFGVWSLTERASE